MKRFNLSVFVLAVCFYVFGAGAALAQNENLVAQVGVSGYDLVSYYTESKPVRGNGNHVVEYEGVTYLFSSEENKSAFEKNPEQYLPAYGGYCAYGTAVGKKFYGDPEVWEIVDGTLYLNLDENIQKEWNKDKQGNIEKADVNWPKIKDKAPADL